MTDWGGAGWVLVGVFAVAAVVLAWCRARVARMASEAQVGREELDRIRLHEVTSLDRARQERERFRLRAEALEALIDTTGPYTGEEEALGRVCEVAPRVLGSGTAATVVERAGSAVLVRAHWGFGAEGPARRLIPFEATAAARAVDSRSVVAIASRCQWSGSKDH